MKFQVIKPFSVTNKGRRVEFKLGQRISEVRYNKLNDRQKSYLTSARSAASTNKIDYTDSEISVLLNSYINSGNRQVVISEFLQEFPNTLHTQSSLNRMCGQMETIDINHPHSVNHVVSGRLIEMASDIDPERFGTPDEVREVSLELAADRVLAELIG